MNPYCFGNIYELAVSNTWFWDYVKVFETTIILNDIKMGDIIGDEVVLAEANMMLVWLA